jgi:putative nucleotidyltransferase with HDIG domain
MARILAKIDRLAPLPTVVMEVIQATEAPKTTFADLERIISRDPIVMARVFKLANSAFYARGVRIQTIGEAVRRLGFATLKTLVIAAGTGKILTQPMPRYAYSPFGFWKHSLALALVTRTLATHLELPNHMLDQLFLAGLMHDIGKLVLDPILGDVVGDSERFTPDMELDVVGVDHPEVGRCVAIKWNLPDYVIAVIAQHHAVSATDVFASHTAIVHLGDCFVNHAKVGLATQEQVDDNIAAAALEILHLDAPRVAELQAVIDVELPNIIGLCEELAQC